LVVLGVDLLGRAFVDENCREVLFRWRDARLRPVISRPLLVRYFRLLRGLGLSEEQVRRWGWWFASPGKVIYSEVEVLGGKTLGEVYARVADLAGAQGVVHGGAVRNLPKEAASLDWISAAEFLERYPP
jgi:hypothetical protein